MALTIRPILLFPFFVVSLLLMTLSFEHREKLLPIFANGAFPEVRRPNASSAPIPSPSEPTTTFPTTPQAIDERNAVTSPLPCLKNAQVESIPEFASFSSELKQFLYYRHCQNFSLLLSPPQKCAVPPGQPLLLIAVRTIASAVDRHDAIRGTWGREGTYSGMQVRRVFAMGLDGTWTARWESARYGDIVQWAFRESYYNLTLKHALFWRWWKTHCTNADFVLSADHDAFVNTFNLVNYLSTRNPNAHLYAGAIEEGLVLRSGKHAMPSAFFSANRYSPYITGLGILFSHASAEALYLGFEENPNLLHIDDVFIGEILRRRGVHAEWLPHTEVKFVSDPSYLKRAMIFHNYPAIDILHLWALTIDDSLRRLASLDPPRPVVLVFPLQEGHEAFEWQATHLRSTANPFWNVTTIVVEQGNKTLLRRGQLINIGILEAARHVGDDTCVVVHDVNVALSTQWVYDACDVPTVVCDCDKSISCGSPDSPSGACVVALSLQQWKDANGYSNNASSVGDIIARARMSRVVTGVEVRRPPKGSRQCVYRQRDKGNVTALCDPDTDSNATDWRNDGLRNFRYATKRDIRSNGHIWLTVDWVRK